MMFRFVTTAILLFIACSLAVLSKPVDPVSTDKPKLPFTTCIKTGKTGKTTGIAHIIEADRARVAHLKGEAAAHDVTESPKITDPWSSNKQVNRRRSMHSINAANAAVYYTVNVTVSDGVSRTLLVDTGSSNTWVGFEQSYAYIDECYQFDEFQLQYGSGYVYGIQCTDETLTLSPDLVVKNQSIGIAQGGYGFTTDGILGIGPVELTRNTVPVDGTYTPTVPDNLYSQGTISTEAIGAFFAPLTSLNVINGEFTFGGADNTAYVGELKYTRLTSTSPADRYWGVDQSVSYGNSIIMNYTAGIVDTGTTLVYLPTESYNAYVKATGAVPDSAASGLLAITEEQYAALKPLVFSIGSAGSYVLSPNAQIWPRSLNTDIGGNESAIYMIVANIGTVSGTGFDFILGYTFLERFYSVFDTTNSRFGIAPTVYTNATTN